MTSIRNSCLGLRWPPALKTWRQAPFCSPAARRGGGVPWTNSHLRQTPTSLSPRSASRISWINPPPRSLSVVCALRACWRKWPARARLGTGSALRPRPYALWRSWRAKHLRGWKSALYKLQKVKRLVFFSGVWCFTLGLRLRINLRVLNAQMEVGGTSDVCYCSGSE